MSTGKRKISVRKVLQTLVTIIVVTGFAMAIISADRKQNSRKVSSVHISIQNDDKVHFVDEAGIEKMLFTDKHMDPESITLGSLDIHNMENIVKSNAWISDAEIYLDNERALFINVTLRVPQVRIFEQSGHSYYIDKSLRAIPLSEDYVHYAPVVTNVPALRNDSVSDAIKSNILWLMNHMAKDKFWNAQVAQVVYAGKNTYELIPVLGKQRILLGDTSRLDDKLANLLAFYRQVANKVGWEKYETIDLRFKDQVVASPKINWKEPKDAAMLNMNWLTAIMDSAPKDDNDEAVGNALDTGIVAARMSTDDVPVPAEMKGNRASQDIVKQPAPAPVVMSKPVVAKPQQVVSSSRPAVVQKSVVQKASAAKTPATKPKTAAIKKPSPKPTAQAKPATAKKDARTTAASPKKIEKKPAPKPVDKKPVAKPSTQKKTANANTPKKPATNH